MPDPYSQDFGDRHVFNALIEALDRPAATIGSVELSGAAWDRHLLVPSERHTAVVNLFDRGTLLGWSGGRARLDAWQSAPLEPTMSDSEVREHIREYALVFGDYNTTLEDGLCALPSAVRDVVLADAFFIVCQGTGFTLSSQFADREGHGRPRCIVLGERATPQTVVEEAIHVWHAGPDDGRPRPAISVAGEKGLLEHETFAPLARRHQSAVERVAAAIQFVWSLHPGRMPIRRDAERTK